MTVFFAFGLAALATYVLRSSMTVCGSHLADSPRLAAAIGLVAPAVLAAIVASALLRSGGQLVQPHLVELGAIVAGFAAVRRTGNVSNALLAGLPVYWVGALLQVT